MNKLYTALIALALCTMAFVSDDYGPGWRATALRYQGLADYYASLEGEPVARVDVPAATEAPDEDNGQPAPTPTQEPTPAPVCTWSDWYAIDSGYDSYSVDGDEPHEPPEDSTHHYHTEKWDFTPTGNYWEVQESDLVCN